MGYQRPSGEEVCCFGASPIKQVSVRVCSGVNIHNARRGENNAS